MKINNIYKLSFFILFSSLIFGTGADRNDERNNKTAEIEIIERNESDDDGEVKQVRESNEKFIYLDQIIDEKEVKAEKKSKLERAINRLDKKINPILRFYVPMSYGEWYLIKTTDVQEANYKNIKYNFNQEENGYRITKIYYSPLKNVWNEDKERAWIKEEKGRVYLQTEKSRFKAYKNEVLYFDPEYRYMIIRFVNDNTLRVFSRYHDTDTGLTGEEKEKYEKIINENKNLKNTVYDSRLIFPDRERAEIEKIKQEERAKKIEERLNQNVESFFQID